MHQPLLLALLEKVYWLDDALQDRFVSLGIPRATRSEIFIVLNVASGTTSAADIARNLGVSRQAISVKLIELQRRGVVTIEEDPRDRRSKTVRFSDVFQANANICVEFMSEIEASLEAAFGKKPVSNFRDVLFADWSEICKGVEPDRQFATARGPR